MDFKGKRRTWERGVRSFRNNALRYGTYPDNLSWRRLAFHLIRDFFGSRVTVMTFLIDLFTQQVFIERSVSGTALDTWDTSLNTTPSP